MSSSNMTVLFRAGQQEKTGLNSCLQTLYLLVQFTNGTNFVVGLSLVRA